MADVFREKIVPLVEHYHALQTDHNLPPSEMHEFSTKLESIFKTVSLPAHLINYWGYTPDTDDAEENTLGNSGINPFPPGSLTLPTTEQEIIDVVQKAYASRSQVRVVGAAHSSPSNIILDAPKGVFPKNVVLISLTKYRGVVIDKQKATAVVKAGTSLDVDPEDPDSTETNSLARILQASGFALPETGGITHQTIGGFLATGETYTHLLIQYSHSLSGSAGGSIIHSFHDAIYGFTLIDGTGQKRVLTRDDADSSLFFAAGVSAGLCGIITDVTLSLTPTFNVTGVQQTSPVQPLNADWLKGCPVNLYGPAQDGVPGIEDYFKDPNNEYIRMVHTFLLLSRTLSDHSAVILAPGSSSTPRSDLDWKAHRSRSIPYPSLR